MLCVLPRWEAYERGVVLTPISQMRKQAFSVDGSGGNEPRKLNNRALGTLGSVLSWGSPLSPDSSEAEAK